MYHAAVSPFKGGFKPHSIISNGCKILVITAIDGSSLGTVLMGVINIGMSITDVDQNFRKIRKGFILIAVAILDVLTSRKKVKLWLYCAFAGRNNIVEQKKAKFAVFIEKNIGSVRTHSPKVVPQGTYMRRGGNSIIYFLT